VIKVPRLKINRHGVYDIRVYWRDDVGKQRNILHKLGDLPTIFCSVRVALITEYEIDPFLASARKSSIRYNKICLCDNALSHQRQLTGND
jgi:hypothetical protein